VSNKPGIIKKQDLTAAKLNVKAVYGDILGADFCENGKEMCFIAQKGGKPQ